MSVNMKFQYENHEKVINRKCNNKRLTVMQHLENGTGKKCCKKTGKSNALIKFQVYKNTPVILFWWCTYMCILILRINIWLCQNLWGIIWNFVLSQIIRILEKSRDSHHILKRLCFYFVQEHPAEVVRLLFWKAGIQWPPLFFVAWRPR